MLVLDFDGNLTDVEAEAGPFTAGYLGDLATLLDKSTQDVQGLADLAYQQIAGDPATHGWRYGDEIMAPATVDPYLRMSAIARKLFDQVDGLHEWFIDRLVQMIFAHHYKNTHNAPKPGLTELLHECHERRIDVRIVSNSHTEPVQGKIRRALGEGTEAIEWWNERVVGNARKYDPKEKLDDHAFWRHAIDRVRFNEFPRDTMLKRPHYLKILGDLKVPLRDIVVVGDIFELDLALPFWLGCHVGLMANEHTPKWEIDLVSSHPRGRILRGVDEILPYYDSTKASAA